MGSFTLITGASSGIGEATACVFAEHKRNLILIARREERLRALADDLRKKRGIDVVICAADIADAGAVQKCFAALRGRKIDVVVNNAGLALGIEALPDAATEDADRMIAVNISGFLHVIQEAIPFLKKSRGHLVNLGSTAGLETYRGGTVYCGTKHFVHGVSKCLRHDLLGTGIRVTEIAPARVETEFSVVRFKGNEQKAAAMYEGFTPLAPHDIAEAIWFAVSRPPHVTIEHLVIYPTDQSNSTTVYKK